jgi:hypothetical protein
MGLGGSALLGGAESDAKESRSKRPRGAIHGVDHPTRGGLPQESHKIVYRRRAPAVATAGPPSGLSWVSLSLAPMGAGANRPPLTGGQLTVDVRVDVLPAARVHWRPPGRVRPQPLRRL